jgi:death-on-curing protein
VTNEPVVHITVDEAIFIHGVLRERHGGSPDLRDAGALESALVRPQLGHYDDLVAEAAALLERLGINHPFVDGNKRGAFGVVDVFRRINGQRVGCTADDAYAFMIGLFESHRFRFEHLEPWLRSVVRERWVRARRRFSQVRGTDRRAPVAGARIPPCLKTSSSTSAAARPRGSRSTAPRNSTP